MDARQSLQNQAFTALSVAEASTLDALFEQLFPADENGPGASSIGVTQYLDRALSGPYAHHLETYRLAASRSFPAKLEGTLNRVAFSAGHVVSNPLADVDPWLTAAVVDHFARAMDTGTDHIAVSLSCGATGDLVFGRAAEAVAMDVFS